METLSGTYYADNVLVSTYAGTVPRLMWRIFGDYYSYARFQIGLPITPEGRGRFSLFWLHDWIHGQESMQDWVDEGRPSTRWLNSAASLPMGGSDLVGDSNLVDRLLESAWPISLVSVLVTELINTVLL
uniref:Uncharacterized protein n=1 Tax=Haptolina brevifila TaxID=156173 RepID=A0A7S2GYG9_9EUKA